MNPPSQTCGAFLARQGERGRIHSVECAYRVLPEIVRSTELQEKLGELKLMKALKVAQGIVDVAANRILRISVTDGNKDAKEVVTTLEKVSKAWIDAS
jgi:hypothetical protein